MIPCVGWDSVGGGQQVEYSGENPSAKTFDENKIKYTNRFIRCFMIVTGNRTGVFDQNIFRKVTQSVEYPLWNETEYKKTSKTKQLRGQELKI